MNPTVATVEKKSAGRRTALAARLPGHAAEYLAEALGLAIFMFSASLCAAALEHPDSPLRAAIASPLLRRVLMGIAMGLTAIAIIHSPAGKLSGAHLNPAVTLTFLRLGKVARRDAMLYVLFQFLGGAAGIGAAWLLLGGALSGPPLLFIATRPGPAGAGAAWWTELAISFLLMAVVLSASGSRLARLTPLLAGSVVALNITIAAPVSGMSMNPARTFASDLAARDFSALWIYFTAPPLGMLAAAQAYLALRGAARCACAKLHHHDPRYRCIFCDFQVTRAASGRPRS